MKVGRFFQVSDDASVPNDIAAPTLIGTFQLNFNVARYSRVLRYCWWRGDSISTLVEVALVEQGGSPAPYLMSTSSPSPPL